MIACRVLVMAIALVVLPVTAVLFAWVGFVLGTIMEMRSRYGKAQ